MARIGKGAWPDRWERLSVGSIIPCLRFHGCWGGRGLRRDSAPPRTVHLGSNVIKTTINHLACIHSMPQLLTIHHHRIHAATQNAGSSLVAPSPRVASWCQWRAYKLHCVSFCSLDYVDCWLIVSVVSCGDCFCQKQNMAGVKTTAWPLWPLWHLTLALYLR